MKNTFIYLLSLSIVLAACQGEEGLEQKKEQLQTYKKEVKDLNSKIRDLEKEIAELDTTFDAKPGAKAVLVSAKAIKKREFEHKIEVRGSVQSKRNIVISAQVGGEIQSINVKEGQPVSKGQVLMTLDADILRNSIAELKTSLELATIVFEKRKNLWEKEIGTEIQYLEAKNNKESLERKLATVQSQLAQTVIKAPFNGVADEIPAKVGEMAAPGMPLIRVVNHSGLYIHAEVSERYIGKFKEKDQVEVYFPSQNKNIESYIKSIGLVINPENRTFQVEVYLPEVDFAVKPNQITVLKIRDYQNNQALVVPTKIIQTDNKGPFVFTVKENGENNVAKKVHVTTGITYNNETEVVSGLSNEELIIHEGFRDLADGISIELTGKGKSNVKMAIN